MLVWSHILDWLKARSLSVAASWGNINDGEKGSNWEHVLIQLFTSLSIFTPGRLVAINVWSKTWASLRPRLLDFSVKGRSSIPSLYTRVKWLRLDNSWFKVERLNKPWLESFSTVAAVILAWFTPSEIGEWAQAYVSAPWNSLIPKKSVDFNLQCKGV